MTYSILVQTFQQWLTLFNELLGRLSDIHGNMSVLVVPLLQPQPTLDWSTILSGSIGGAATLLAALFVFWRGNKREREIRAEEARQQQEVREDAERKKAAATALSGYFKLSKWSNLISNINLQIDRCYKAAEEHGLSSSEAFETIGPSIGIFAEPELLEPSEFSFLLTKENYELVTDMGLVEERAMNLHHLFNQYSKMHVELQMWLDAIPGFSRSLDGPIATDKIPDKYKERFDFRAAQLNQIIVGIVESLDEDIEFSIKTTQKFILAAHETYKPYFPKLEFE